MTGSPSPVDGISLRSVRESDHHVLFEWVNDRTLRIQSAPFRPVSWIEHMAWLEGVLGDPSRELLIIQNGAGEPLGQIVISSISPLHRSCEFSIRIGRESDRGRGIGTAAVRQLLQHAWKDLGLHRVSLTVHETNLRARRTYERAGFVTEGTLRDAAFIDGSWVNLVVMSMLSTDAAPASFDAAQAAAPRTPG